MTHQPVFPFISIVGQEEMKLALLLNAVNPKTGGVLLRGEKGTAKSTLVRALSALLDVPFVNLPLNATEDRLAGSIDLEMTMTIGERSVRKGLLADAHGGFLYVDEVNLLDDHITDILLDCSASGVVHLQREGVSEVYNSEFVLAGSMNPEEGELRPQFLDRFGLSVQVTASASAMERVLLMESRERFDADPQSFIAAAQERQTELKNRIQAARTLSVCVDDSIINYIAETVLNANAAGHRADIVIAEAAKAHAALNGRDKVLCEDVDAVAEFALAHRRRQMEAQNPETQNAPKENKPQQDKDNQETQDSSQRTENNSHESEGSSQQQSEGAGMETVFSVGELFGIKKIETAKDRKNRKGSGRRSRTRTDAKHGRYVRATENRGSGDIAIDATLRTAAANQFMRTPPAGFAIAIEHSDIREKQRERRIGNFILFIVDSSGSMGARARMAAAKGAVVSLLLDTYQKRDKVAMIAFRGEGSEILLQPTSSVELAERKLRELPTGGKTPLSAAIEDGRRLTGRYLRHNPDSRPVVIIMTDGRANVPYADSANPRKESQELAANWAREQKDVKFIVIDTEKKGLADFALSGELASALGAKLLEIKDLKADSLLNAVRGSFSDE
ncbi:VWA domain-containing protein [Seleniivibrio sp.]|uniref:VWA domain-containing protein n=1 Tax=Seleniivibrio sp. TaxID=2898801 RepID=UPI0025D29B50|nr:VWA domain-containing protein [Seleniivibrio sp.]MCD8554730.1 VWA domain-containing protein [Seleniivibrio sp.]